MRSRAVSSLVAVSMGLSRLFFAGQDDKSPLRIVTFFRFAVCLFLCNSKCKIQSFCCIYCGRFRCTILFVIGFHWAP